MHQAQAASPAETYDRYFVPSMFAPSARLLLEQTALRPGERVLDVACGTGVVARMAAPVAGASGRVTGLDIAPHMLAVARAGQAPAGAPIEWREGDAMAMPFADGVFDAVVSQHGLPFIPDQAAAVRDMRRVLKPGGRAVVVVWQALSRHIVFEALMQAVARHLGLPLAEVEIPFALGDAEKLRSLFAAARFRTVEIRPGLVTGRFHDCERFVQLNVASAAATLPAFRKLQDASRAAVFEAVRAEVEPLARQYRDGDAVVLPLYAHVVRAIA